MKTLFALVVLMTSALSFAEPVDVLIVGDSHMYSNFGAELTKNIANGGKLRVRTFGAVSTRPLHWLNGTTPFGHKCQTITPKDANFKECGGGNKSMTKWRDLIAQYRPRAVVIVLGTNSLEGGTLGPDYQQMVEASRGTQVIWVGPPMLRPDQSKGWKPGRIQVLANHLDQIYKQFRLKMPYVDFIDARAMTKKGLPAGETHDGVHRSIKGGSAWAKSLAQAVLKIL